MSFPQQHTQPEDLCLRYPENFGVHATVTYDSAVHMLMRAIPMSQQVPYTWGYIDKPAEGQVLLLFLSPQAPFPNDGIRWQEPEGRYVIPVGSNRELEVMEVKFGYIPGQDSGAWRVRRRYRMHKGGHPQLNLVHYTRGQPITITPALMNQPVRAYPLRIVNEPAVYVMGDRKGQKVYSHNAPAPGAPPPQQQPHPQQHQQQPQPQSVPIPQMGMNMNMNMNMNATPQAMLAQQNSNMEALESRRERERARHRSASTSGRPPPPREDDDSGDEMDHISTRTLALTRYRRNHELMGQVFYHAAFGEKGATPKSSPYSIFNQSDLEGKSNLEAEIEALKARAAERHAASLLTLDSSDAQVASELDDVSMEAALRQEVIV